jgi:hypothetical protein
VVLLKLDPSQFTEAQRQALADVGQFTERMGAAFDNLDKKQKQTSTDEVKRQKEREAQNRKIADSYKEVTNQVLKLGATLLATGSVVAFTKQTMAMDNSMARFADRLNLNKADLAFWISMMAQMGVSTATAQAGIQSTTQAINELHTQIMFNPGAVAGQMGILAQVAGPTGIRDTADPFKLFQDIHDTITRRHMGAGSAQVGQTTSWLSALGFDQNTISMLEQSQADWDKNRPLAQASVPATVKQMKDAEDAQQALSRLEGILHRIAGDANGPLAKFFTAVANFADKNPKIAEAAVGITALGVALEGLMIALLPILATLAFFRGAPAAAAPAAAAAGGGSAEAAAGGGILAAMGGALLKVLRIGGPVGAFLTTLLAPTPLGNKDRYPGGHVPGGAAHPGAGAGAAPLSLRNNNPGNLIDPVTGGFRHFATMGAGFAAMGAQILRDFNVHGLKTVADLIGNPRWGWSPANAKGNTAASTANYIAAVARALHVAPNQRLNLDPQTITALMNAMAGVEAGPGAHAPRAGIQIGTVVMNVQSNDGKKVAKEFVAAVSTASRGLV